jgi:hypothetical protein
MNILQQVARRRCAATGSPARPAPHPQHAAGGNSNLSSGSSTRHIGGALLRPGPLTRTGTPSPAQAEAPAAQAETSPPVRHDPAVPD